MRELSRISKLSTTAPAGALHAGKTTSSAQVEFLEDPSPFLEVSSPLHAPQWEQSPFLPLFEALVSTQGKFWTRGLRYVHS